ncbi:NAD(P)-dependent oxidoreductase [Conexibacter sp. CPCC 206217]|uniref:NAD(P)-dependent oxidoreductase n=1 Tax=Conexibacter sp. CPCC 206217 TaxID=3064574 RepID=UPI002723197F|nr:NAD(P)-dependent oxidoreductase [Conexibacter sp. CPCC 206217]MDO8212247.1 NAD(P)-dependent oxidoreductase [Conexibacter sp. CPCC 206217]
MSASPTAIGFVGLGAMGTPMAGRLLDAGHTLVVHDLDDVAVAALVARGAQQASSPRAVADASEIVFVSLPSPAAVRAVALGADGIASAGAGASAGARTYVDVSTTGPQTAEEVADALAANGIGVVDAPVSGGPAGAAAGTLTFMVAGADDAVARVRPLLETLGKAIFHVGARPGQAQTTKVINNLVSAACIAITSEATVLGAKAGLDPAVLLDVVGVSSGSNNAALDKFPKQVLTRRFAHGFRLELMAKDVRLCLEEGRRQEVPMLLGGMVDQLWRLAAAQEPDGADCTAFTRMIEAWGGAVVASPPQLADAAPSALATER